MRACFVSGPLRFSEMPAPTARKVEACCPGR
jgi:hypothetical protein